MNIRIERKNIAPADQVVASVGKQSSDSSYFVFQQPEYPRDCKEVLNTCSSTHNTSGVYLIKPDGYPEPFEAYCDNEFNNGGWTGEDCIPQNQCSCFAADKGTVLMNGESYVNSGCTRRSNCSNNQLMVEDSYHCSDDATCDVREGVRRCYCIDGYEGDGVTCTRKAVPKDCQELYVDGSSDGVYTIYPDGWPSGIQVYCEMESNGGGWTVIQRRSSAAVDFFVPGLNTRPDLNILEVITGLVMMLCRVATTNNSAHVTGIMMSRVPITAPRSIKEPGGSAVIIIIAVLKNIIAIISLSEVIVPIAHILTSTETTTAQLEERTYSGVVLVDTTAAYNMQR
ncbi:Fibrinogen C domain-containing protein 1-A [Apostichopus japonicus]|uniref:Fibrinogen C domain-containing protein 1-A n=1 Tax=Stichopus japonicus TaxID=307972 RepID=A0A2G8LHB1_STIJA|nr:Fibrinogen C domain-containing protein 1-A [Apostichopus japonicus]